MSKIEAAIIKHSKCPRGHELVTYELIFPRFLLAELNTHRMFSKNSASSRAIPFKKMVEMVKKNPFKPIAYQAEHKGMQGTEYIANETGRGGDLSRIEVGWDKAVECAIEQATWMNDYGLTKQLCNRLLEPFMWHKVVLTTELEGLRNFFELRCPEYVIGLTPYKSKKECVNTQRTLQEPSPECLGFTELDWLKLNKGQAEIHMMELAEQMYDAYNESVPHSLKEGEWHIPYEELIDLSELAKLLSSNLTIPSDYYETECDKDLDSDSFYKTWLEPYVIKASTGMLARTSYITIGDDKVPSIETLVGIHDKMFVARPFHASPFEHCSQVPTESEYMSNVRGDLQTDPWINDDGSALIQKTLDKEDEVVGWFRNFRGFKQYRMILEQAHQA